jgi:hypothetical protein
MQMISAFRRRNRVEARKSVPPWRFSRECLECAVIMGDLPVNDTVAGSQVL